MTNFLIMVLTLTITNGPGGKPLTVKTNYSVIPIVGTNATWWTNVPVGIFRVKPSRFMTNSP